MKGHLSRHLCFVRNLLIEAVVVIAEENSGVSQLPALASRLLTGLEHARVNVS